MPAQEWLTFQFRPSFTKLREDRKPDLQKDFLDKFTDEAQKGHWSVRLTSLSDARQLLSTICVD